MWLRYLQAYHDNYRDIRICKERIASLLLNSDISSSFLVLIVDDIDEGGFRDRPEFELDEGLYQQSMVPNLNTNITESDIVLNKLSGRNL